MPLDVGMDFMFPGMQMGGAGGMAGPAAIMPAPGTMPSVGGGMGAGFMTAQPQMQPSQMNMGGGGAMGNTNTNFGGNYTQL